MHVFRFVQPSREVSHIFSYEKEVAELLSIPYEQVTQVVLIPVAYMLGTDFRPTPHEPLQRVLHINKW